MKVSSFVQDRMREYLEQYRVVVWYDGEGAFEEVFDSLDIPDCTRITATESRLRARRDAEDAFERLSVAEGSTGAAPSLLIYVPMSRFTDEKERVQDLFEGFAVVGTAFGDQESERLQSLARQAMPDAASEIDGYFAKGMPAIRMLDALEQSTGYAALGTACGTESVVEIVSKLLCDDEFAERIELVPGARDELLRLLQTELGFEAPDGQMAVDDLLPPLGRFVLVSELAACVGRSLSDSLTSIPVAPDVCGDRVSAVCERMRNDASLREHYMDLADRVARELNLQSLVDTGSCTWSEDTFGFQNDAALRSAATFLLDNAQDRARALVESRRQSVWTSVVEQGLRWRALERCVAFAEYASGLQHTLPQKGTAVHEWIEAYSADDGLWRLDRHQRLFEQGYAECPDAEVLDGVVDRCRATYRKQAEALQEQFLGAVKADGWPADGFARATQTYERHVAPALTERTRVVYFLVDALRYELARDLVEGLAPLGRVELTPAAASLPTTTPVGMAALMPGADGALRLEKKGDELVPNIGERSLPASSDRMALLKVTLGDRFKEITLSELLSSRSVQLNAKYGSTDLLVVRSQDIDAFGEGTNLLMAREFMSKVLTHLRKATDALVALGFEHFVFAADHGHVLLPEIPPGDVVAAPQGEWLLEKRRCRLGSCHGSSPGSLVMKARDLGIDGPAPELVVPTGLKVFSAGGGYFHEGISLQECVLPVVVLDASGRAADSGEGEVRLAYKADKFTSRVVGVKVWFNAMLADSRQVRVEAYDGAGQKAAVVGEAADCDARDATSGLVTLRSGAETQVPILISEGFSGDKIEVRVVDPVTGLLFAKLSLKNAMLD